MTNNEVVIQRLISKMHRSPTFCKNLLNLGQWVRSKYNFVGLCAGCCKVVNKEEDWYMEELCCSECAKKFIPNKKETNTMTLGPKLSCT